jgi:hypothetical protein
MSTASPAAPPDRPTAASRLPLARRIAYVLAGVTLVIAFFMPWVKAGSLLSSSGFGLLFVSGEMVEVVSGSYRFLLVLVPLFGALLVTGGVLAWRATQWLAVGGAAVILGFGFIQLVRVFLTSTGVGMWLVVVASMLCLVLGLLGIGRGSE